MSLAPKTTSSYASAFNRYTEFCTHHHLPLLPLFVPQLLHDQPGAGGAAAVLGYKLPRHPVAAAALAHQDVVILDPLHSTGVLPWRASNRDLFRFLLVDLVEAKLVHAEVETRFDICRKLWGVEGFQKVLDWVQFRLIMCTANICH